MGKSDVFLHSSWHSLSDIGDGISQSARIHSFSLAASVAIMVGSWKVCASTDTPCVADRRCMASPRDSPPLPSASNCFSIQAKASANKTLDFLAAAPPYFCSSEQRVPTGQPPRASASRFLILTSKKAQSRSLGELALSISARSFLNRETRSSTMALPISSLVL